MRSISSIEVLLNGIHSNDLPSLMQSQTRIEESLRRIEVLYRPGAEIEKSRKAQQQASGTSRSPSSVEISVSHLVSQVTKRRCPCQQRVSTQINTYLGRLFLGYAATPKGNICQHTFLHYVESGLCLKYFLPIRLLRRALFLQAKISASGTISSSLTITPIIPGNHIIFDLIDVGDLDGIKRLLTTHQMSIDAVSPQTLGSPLFVRPLTYHKFFIHHKADCISNSTLYW